MDNERTMSEEQHAHPLQPQQRLGPNWMLIAVVLLLLTLTVGIWWGSVFLSTPVTQRDNPLFRDSVRLSRAFDMLVGMWFFTTGACVASFLNVVAYRLPLGISLIGYSRCPFCFQPILSQDNIPILGWFKLRGRCRGCQLPISFRYPGFELLGGIVGASFYLVEVLTHLANLPGDRVAVWSYGMLTGSIDWFAIANSLIHLVLIFFLIAIAMTRWSHQTPPIRLFAWGIGVALVLYLVHPLWLVVPWRPLDYGAYQHPTRIDALLTWLIGCSAGAGVGVATWLLFGKRIVSTGRSASEYANLLAWLLAFVMIGGFLGWQALPSIAVLLSLWLAILAVPRFLLRWKEGAIPDPMAWIWFSTMLHLFTWHWQGKLL